MARRAAAKRSWNLKCPPEFIDPSREWRRLLAEVWGTFLLVAVAAGGAIAADTSPDKVSFGMAVVAPGLTVMIAWVLVHTLFIFHYAHLYYGDRKEPGQADGGLDFPGDDRPDYWDFAYFSFCIAMTSQVSDVQVSSQCSVTITH